MEIVVYGKPGPQGSKSFKGFTNAGKAVLAENSKKVTPWRNEVSLAAIRELERIGRPAPFSCAVSVIMAFTFIRPKSATRSKRPHPSVFPDLSKIVRSTEDALTDAGVWNDDALVVKLFTLKTYANESYWALDRGGARIIVEPMVDLALPPGRGLQAAAEGYLLMELEAP